MNNARKSIGNTAVICLSPYYGGMEMDAVRIARLLSPVTSVTLVVKSDAYIEKNFVAESGVNHVSLVGIKFKYNFSISMIRQVRKLLQEQHIKNVIFFGASELRSLYFAFLGLDVNLIIRHGTTKSRPKKDAFHRLIYSNVKYHVAICKHLAANVQYIIPFGKAARLQLIYSSLRAMPVNIRQRSVLAGRRVNILHVGRVTRGKGHLDAIEACDELYKNDVGFSLRFVGGVDDDYSEVVTSFLARKSYHDNVSIEGHTDDVAGYYRDADIFLFPSEGEGLSNAFIEALSYGLACVAYDNTSFPELRDLGFNMFLATDRDTDSLRQALYNAYLYTTSQGVPIDENVKLADTLFSAKRELTEFIEILI